MHESTYPPHICTAIDLQIEPTRTHLLSPSCNPPRRPRVEISRYLLAPIELGVDPFATTSLPADQGPSGPGVSVSGPFRLRAHPSTAHHQETTPPHGRATFTMGRKSL
jgi:hypothetical protein